MIRGRLVESVAHEDLLALAADSETEETLLYLPLVGLGPLGNDGEAFRNSQGGSPPSDWARGKLEAVDKGPLWLRMGAAPLSQ